MIDSKTVRGAERRRWFRSIYAIYLILCAAVAWDLEERLRDEYRSRPRVIEESPLEPGEVLWNKHKEYVRDEVVGHRCRRNWTIRSQIAPLGSKQRVSCVRHYNNQGFISALDFEEPLGTPRLLLIGDSHLTGVVMTERNASSLLEAGLRNRTPAKGALVVNASAAFYSLYQLVLRMRALKEFVRPQFLIAVVFMGNDFVELEDIGRPHLDDEGNECPADPDPPKETTSERRKWLGLSDELLFWQGLNQAAYFFLRPDRMEAIERKTRICLELLKVEATAASARLMVVQLPSYDVVFPDGARALSENAERLVDAGLARHWHQRFGEMLREGEVESIDLLPAFEECGEPSIYASDYHIFEKGHFLVARALFDRLAPAMRDR